MKHSYASEKLEAAIYTLATGRGTIRDRLFYAWQCFMNLEELHFPDELVPEFKKIMNSLCSESAPSGIIKGSEGNVTEGKVQNTLKDLTVDECVNIAKQIYELKFQVSSSINYGK